MLPGVFFGSVSFLFIDIFRHSSQKTLNTELVHGNYFNQLLSRKVVLALVFIE